MTTRQVVRSSSGVASDPSALAPATEAQRAERAPELRLVCTSWRSFTRLQDELRELDALTLPLSSGPDGIVSLAIETPDGEVVHLPACLTGGVVAEGGLPEALILRVDLDEALRQRLASYAAHASALVHEDAEALSRLRSERIGAYHVSGVARRAAAERSATSEPGTSNRASQRPTQPAPSPSTEPGKR